MSTREETKKDKILHFRIPMALYLLVKKLEVNVSDTCREAIKLEISKIVKIRK